jgi:hypothetical protein
MYKILEARIEYKNSAISRVTVLVDMTGSDLKPDRWGDVRAIYATAEPRNGYMNIQPHHSLNDELLQEVAGYGMETVDRDKIFPGWKSKKPSIII